MVHRRDFLTGALALGATALLAPRGLQGAEAKVEILINEPIGTISPNLYSHFVEHLGGVVYDGIWVGENSKVPNIGGIRKELVEHMRRIKPGVIRWPGGCFADQYDWRDGIGPREKRPRRVNFWADTNYKVTEAYKQLKDGPQKYEPNWFGTNEFVRFCRLTGAQPYFAANLRSLDARVFLEWIEYCNAPAGLTTLSDMRAAAGDREPYNVAYWGVGNESWGCGGDMLPEEYAEHFRRVTAWAPTYQTTKLSYIASGANGADVGWTRRFLSKLVEKGSGQLNKVYGLGLHYYCGTTGKGNALEYTEDEWYELIHRSDRMESLVTQHWMVMGESDPQRRVKLVVDEWGAWHLQDASLPAGYLYAYPGTLRDALISAVNLDTFQRHADKVAMANPAQLVNTIHSLFIAYEDKFVATPNFHVFEMYAAHAGAQAVRTQFVAPRVSYSRTVNNNRERAEFWGLAGSASLNGKQLTLTAVNPDAKATRETEIDVPGARIASCQARVLTSNDIHAHNSFGNPQGLQPKDDQVTVGPAGKLVYGFAPASVTRLQMTLI